MHVPLSSRTPLTRPARRAPLLWIGLALLVCLLAPATAHAQFEGDTVDRVEIDGLASYSPSEITSNLKIQAGQPYRPLDAAADLQALARIMRTASVSVEPEASGQVIVRYTVTEFPRLRELQIVGNEKVTTERIKTVLKMKPGETVLDSRTIQSARRALEDEYRQRGLTGTQITVNQIDVTQPAAEGKPERPQADLQVLINEGRQVLCDDVIIHGNHAFSSTRLRLLINTSGSWLFVKNYYDDQTFEDDLAKLRDLYAGYGYFDARVTRGTFQVRNEGGKQIVSPVIEINEGQRYTVGKVDVRGERLYSRAEIEACFAGLHGKEFDGRDFAAALDKVQSLYADHGLLTTEIRPEYSYDAEHHELNLLVNITEHDRIYVGKVRVERPRYKPESDQGSWFRGWYDQMAPPVKDEVIRQEVLLEPGEIYNRRLERDSLRRLARLGVFETNSLSVHDEPTADPDIHDVVVEATDAVTGSLNGGVGFGDATGAFIYAGFNEKNVGGNADVFSFGANIGTRTSAASISYLNRHLGDTRDSLETRLYYQVQSLPGYDANTGGLQSEWGHPMRDNWTRYLRARVEGVKLSRANSTKTDVNLDKVYGVAALRLRFEQDTREPYGGPWRNGYLQSVGLEAGYAGGPLVNFSAMRDQYRPISDRLTWRLYTEAGLMPYNRDIVPINERYFLGGNTDMRGFAFRGAGYFDARDHDVPIGGAAKVLIKNELIFPIISPVSGVLFADVGDLGESPLSWQVPRVSTGAGVRFDMQQVQVGLDLAVPIVTQSDDQTRFFHFSLESRF